MPNALEEVHAALAEHFRGELFSLTDLEYDQAHRIWNAAVQRRPGLIARCNDVADVITAVKCAAGAGCGSSKCHHGSKSSGWSGCDYRNFRPCLNQDLCGTLIPDLFDAAPRSRRTWSLCLAQSTSAS